jgi:hypothetical protein
MTGRPPTAPAPRPSRCPGPVPFIRRSQDAEEIRTESPDPPSPETFDVREALAIAGMRLRQPLDQSPRQENARLDPDRLRCLGAPCTQGRNASLHRSGNPRFHPPGIPGQLGLGHRRPAGDDGQQDIRLVPDQSPRDAGDARQILRRPRPVRGKPDQDLAAQHLEGRAAARARPGLPSHVQLPQRGEPTPIQRPGPFHAEKVLGVERAGRGWDGRQRLALLLDPPEASPAHQVGLQSLPQCQEMEDVAGRILHLFGAEGPHRPVVLLPGCRRGDPQVPLQQGIQAEGGKPQELGTDHGVKDPGEGEDEVSLQGGQVVGGPVEDLDPPGIRAEGRQWREVAHLQGVDEKRLTCVPGQLQQADLLGVTVQAIRFRIQGEGACRSEAVRKRVEIPRRANPARGKVGRLTETGGLGHGDYWTSSKAQRSPAEVEIGPRYLIASFPVLVRGVMMRDEVQAISKMPDRSARYGMSTRVSAGTSLRIPTSDTRKK